MARVSAEVEQLKGKLQKSIDDKKLWLQELKTCREEEELSFKRAEEQSSLVKTLSEKKIALEDRLAGVRYNFHTLLVFVAIKTERGKIMCAEVGCCAISVLLFINPFLFLFFVFCFTIRSQRRTKT